MLLKGFEPVPHLYKNETDSVCIVTDRTCFLVENANVSQLGTYWRSQIYLFIGKALPVLEGHYL